MKKKKDIEFLLEKEPLSEKRKDSIKISLTFFKHDTKVKFFEKEVRIVSKIKYRLINTFCFGNYHFIFDD